MFFLFVVSSALAQNASTSSNVTVTSSNSTILAALGLSNAHAPTFTNVSAALNASSTAPPANIGSSVSQLRLNISCATVSPCQPNFVCVPQLANGTFLPPVIPDADYIAALQQSAQQAQFEAMLCEQRQQALADAVSKLNVGLSLAMQIVNLLVNEAVQAQQLTVNVLSYLAALAQGAGLIANGSQLPCNQTFSADECAVFDLLSFLQEERKTNPNALLPLNQTQLQGLLFDQINASDIGELVVLANLTSPANPFAGNVGAVTLFQNVLLTFAAVQQADAQVAAQNITADPSLVAIDVMSRQFVRLAEYSAEMQEFAPIGVGFLSQNLSQLIYNLSTVAPCTNASDASPGCTSAKWATLKNVASGIIQPFLIAAQLIEISQVRGALIYQFVQVAVEHVQQLFYGVSQCVPVVEAHFAAVQAAETFVTQFFAQHADLVNQTIATLQQDVANVSKYIAEVQALPSHNASDLPPADQQALIAAVTKLQTDQAAAQHDIQQVVGAGIAAAQYAVCRQVLDQTIQFELRAVCQASDDDATCITRLESYFNGIKANLEANNGSLAAQLEQIADCWPLLRIEIDARIVAGAFVVASNSSIDPTLAAMTVVATDPCSAINGTCQAVQGRLIIPADCSPVPPMSASNTTDQSLLGSSGMMRRRRAASTSSTASAFVAVLQSDPSATITSTPNTAYNPSASDYPVATSAALVTPPTCAQLGLSSCSSTTAGGATSAAGSTAGTTAAGTTAAATGNTAGTTGAGTTGAGTTAAGSTGSTGLSGSTGNGAASTVVLSIAAACAAVSVALR